MLPLGLSFQIEDGTPVRLLWEVLEGMDFTATITAPEAENTAVSARGKTAILLFGAMNGIFSTRSLEEACKNDIRYMWLLDGHRAPDHSTLSRFRQFEMPVIMEELFRQLMVLLYELGEIDYETAFIDGTKLEANANRYSFVWKKSVEKHLARLREKAEKRLLEIGVVEPVSPELLHHTAMRLYEEMAALGIQAVYGKGHHKSIQQRLANELEQLAGKWEEYEQHLAVIGDERNSYSKTDHDATFMHMKEDHMRNGQLKAAYNMQVAVNSEYIVGFGAFNDRNDSGTLIPFLKALQQLHRRKYKSVTADAGYESHENYAYLEENEQLSFIKPSNYESSKKKNKNWVGRAEDMQYCPDDDCFICAAGKTLIRSGSKTRKSKTGYESKVSLYTCTECMGCAFRHKCSRSTTNNDTKQIGICWDFAKLREDSLANIQSDKGIVLRVNRSIQSEGTFGVLKQDWGFRRFLTRGKHNITTEFAILAFAFNIKKLHAKIQQNRTGTQLFEVRIA